MTEKPPNTPPTPAKPRMDSDAGLALAIAALLAGGAALGNTLGPEPGARMLGGVLSGVGLPVHPEWMVCPFCGGTRAFLACCAGQWKSAASFSLAGVAAFAYLIALLLACTAARLRGLPDGLRARAARARMRLTNGPWIFAALLATWGMHLALHYGGLLRWRVLDP